MFFQKSFIMKNFSIGQFVDIIMKLFKSLEGLTTKVRASYE